LGLAALVAFPILRENRVRAVVAWYL
jgi:hypothetical protein